MVICADAADILSQLAAAGEERTAILIEVADLTKRLDDRCTVLDKVQAAIFAIAAVCHAATGELAAGESDTATTLIRVTAGVGALAAAMTSLDLPPPFN